MTPDTMTIYRLLSVAASTAHELPAILAPGREPLTYRELSELINGTMNALHELGIGRGDRVLGNCGHGNRSTAEPRLSSRRVRLLLGGLEAQNRLEHKGRARLLPSFGCSGSAGASPSLPMR